jgi:hypothetical protein
VTWKWDSAYNRAPLPARLVLLAAPQGRRLYIYGRRVHHGLVGAILAALGLGLLAHDWRDRPWPLRDGRR